MPERRYTNVLTINHDGKGIPYGGSGEPREDGSANYGFKNLKGALERLSEIPELEADAALFSLIEAINQPDTGLLSIGCVSGAVADERGHRVSGYVEFAFNSETLIADATHYFPVFFHFDRALLEDAFAYDVHFYWELMGATFHEAQAAGFTASVTINTGYHETPQAAQTAWDEALSTLARFLSSIPPGPGRRLY